MTDRLREARLRPEFASAYPEIEPGVWILAANVAALRVSPWRDGGQPAGGRALSDEAFEFRGGIEESSVRSRARTRWTDHVSRVPRPAPHREVALR